MVMKFSRLAKVILKLSIWILVAVIVYIAISLAHFHFSTLSEAELQTLIRDADKCVISFGYNDDGEYDPEEEFTISDKESLNSLAESVRFVGQPEGKWSYSRLPCGCIPSAMLKLFYRDDIFHLSIRDEYNDLYSLSASSESSKKQVMIDCTDDLLKAIKRIIEEQSKESEG